MTEIDELKQQVKELQQQVKDLHSFIEEKMYFVNQSSDNFVDNQPPEYIVKKYFNKVSINTIERLLRKGYLSEDFIDQIIAYERIPFSFHMLSTVFLYNNLSYNFYSKYKQLFLSYVSESNFSIIADSRKLNINFIRVFYDHLNIEYIYKHNHGISKELKDKIKDLMVFI